MREREEETGEGEKVSVSCLGTVVLFQATVFVFSCVARSPVSSISFREHFPRDSRDARPREPYMLTQARAEQQPLYKSRHPWKTRRNGMLIFPAWVSCLMCSRPRNLRKIVKDLVSFL